MNNAPSVIPAYALGIIRAVGVAAGGWLINRGYVTADQAGEIGGALLVAAGVVWSLVAKYNAHQALTSAIAAPAGKAS